jgi:hypothetical protein
MFIKATTFGHKFSTSTLALMNRILTGNQAHQIKVHDIRNVIEFFSFIWVRGESMVIEKLPVDVVLKDLFFLFAEFLRMQVTEWVCESTMKSLKSG